MLTAKWGSRSSWDFKCLMGCEQRHSKQQWMLWGLRKGANCQCLGKSAGSGCRHMRWAHKSRDKHLLFAFSVLDFAKPKMPHKLEEARTSVIQGFSDVHQPFIRTMLGSWIWTLLFPAASKRAECMGHVGGVWVMLEEKSNKEQLQNNHSRRDASCPVTLEVLNPLG